MKTLKSKPKLFTAQGNIAEKWYVHFSAINPATNKPERVRLFSGFAKYPDYTDRLNYGKKYIAEITAKLDSGWCPFSERSGKTANGHAADLRTALFSVYEYLKHDKQWRDKTKADYNSCINAMLTWALAAKVRSVNAIDVPMAKQFLTWLNVRGAGAVTLNKYRSFFGGVWAVMVQDKRAKQNPWRDIKKYREVKEGKLAYNDTQAAALKEEMQKTDPWLWLCCAFQYYCFLRPVSEVRLIRVQDIDFAARKLRVSGLNVKTGKSKVQDIPTQLYDLLVELKVNEKPGKHYVFGGAAPVSKNVFYKRHAKIQKRLGIGQQFSLYSWKHTGNVALYRKFHDIKLNQAINDHSDISTTDIYLKSKGAYDSEKVRNEFPSI